ncbi:hypothetical protein ABZX85_43795 [Streptomyces sp. NPDC004539]|uniref:hypothetical protein n=1 Tax=Streptomyces sp. NPDC004539 TaxID=3154280 RepID=UPI0033A9CE17
MTQDTVGRPARPAARRDVPLLATLIGLPLFLWELSWLWGDEESLPFVGAIGVGFVLVAVSWVVPRDEAYRRARALVGYGGVVVGALPAAWLVLMIPIMLTG